MSKVVLFANTDWYLFNFRLNLANALRDLGHDLILLSPAGRYGDKLRALGFDWRPFPFSTRSTNPFTELNVIRRLVSLYRAERPNLVHHFTIKCVLYGSVAARLSGNIPTINAIPGMGYVFTDQGAKVGLLRAIVRSLYRLTLNSTTQRTIFQNRQDMDYFVSSGLVDENKVHLIRGSGVSGETFSPVTKKKGNGPPIVLFGSRLLREKGIFELLAAVRILNDSGCKLRLLVAGEPYPENPSSLDRSEMEALRMTPGVEYLGHVDDMPSLMARADMVVLPTYYPEGTPRVLVEAAAAGRPIVATNISGCQGVVEDGVNGFLVPVRDVPGLVAAIRRLVTDAALRERFGRQGRQIFEAGFSEELVLERTLEVYRELLG